MSDGKKRFAGVDERGKYVFKSIEPFAWQCPACGCGVRGDVEVCPNCVKREARKSEPVQSGDDFSRGIAGGEHAQKFRPLSEMVKD
jgi:hypothetical protein